MFCNYFSNTLRAGLELWVKTVFSSISLVLSAVKNYCISIGRYLCGTTIFYLMAGNLPRPFISHEFKKKSIFIFSFFGKIKEMSRVKYGHNYVNFKLKAMPPVVSTCKVNTKSLTFHYIICTNPVCCIYNYSK